MPKRLCIDGGEQADHSARGLYSDMSKRPFLAHCSGLSEDTGISDMTKLPFLGRCSGRAAKQKYLHLVLNDWDRGYSIYRLGGDDFVADADLDATQPSLLVRIVAQNARSGYFAAHGTKILAMHPAESSPGIPVFDTEILAVTVCPCPLSRGDCGTKPLYTSVGSKLLSFVYPFVEVLGPEPALTEEPWSWARAKQMPPFDSRLVSSYAVHPDGHTIFVSFGGCKRDPGLTLPSVGGCTSRTGTFTFNIESLEWIHIGHWLLPFKGPACYDQELDAWVGLCLLKEGAGQVCCCDVPPATGRVTMPVWKLAVDVLFDDNSKRHLGATLVYMGNSRFCLAESRMPKDDDFYPRLRAVKMTCFLLRYGKEGELGVAGRCTYASMVYQINHEHVDKFLNPIAFWM